MGQRTHVKYRREDEAVITVRCSKRLHRRLVSEAHRRETTLNKLCVRILWEAMPSNGPESEMGTSLGN